MNLFRLAQKELPGYYTELLDEVLFVSEEKGQTPFASILVESDVPDIYVLSFAVDYGDATTSAAIAVSLTNIAPVFVSEGFYIDKSGSMHFGEEAIERWNLDSIDLNEIEFDQHNPH